MRHLNGNIMAAIDVETTGRIPGYHDIVQLTILPLTFDLEPDPNIVPFDVLMQPGRPGNIDYDAMRINKCDLKKVNRIGMDPIMCIDMLHEWHAQLKLPNNKRIVPLGQNYSFDLMHLVAWMGYLNYSSVFDYHYRDLMISSLFHNDVADFHSDEIPHPQVGLKDLAGHLGVEMDSHRAHDSLYDCVITARCYKAKLLRMNIVGW